MSNAIDSIVKVFRGIARLRGSTDNTLIGNVSDRLKTDADVSDVQFTNKTLSLFGIIQSSGFLAGESYDEISYTEDLSGEAFLSFLLNGVEQFILEINVTDQMNWRVIKTFPVGFLFQENGDKLLQEDGFALLVQGLIPA